MLKDLLLSWTVSPHSRPHHDTLAVQASQPPVQAIAVSRFLAGWQRRTCAVHAHRHYIAPWCLAAWSSAFAGASGRADLAESYRRSRSLKSWLQSVRSTPTGAAEVDPGSHGDGSQVHIKVAIRILTWSPTPQAPEYVAGGSRGSHRRCKAILILS